MLQTAACDDGLPACAWFCRAGGASAANEDYPKKEILIRLIVPFPAGAGPDNVARMLGQHLQDTLGQTVVIENRAGALGSIGAAGNLARSAPDGYTLLMGTNTTQAGNVSMLKNLPYDPAKDFAPITRAITTAMVMLVKPDFPPRTSQGIHGLCQGSSRHDSRLRLRRLADLGKAQLQSRGGLSIVAASYRGVPQSVTDVMAGVIDLAFADFSMAIPQMQGGTLRGIGVTSPKRNELTPGLPALAEAMPGFEATIWYGLLAPVGTPEPIVRKLYATCLTSLSMPATREKLAKRLRDWSDHAPGRIRRLYTLPKSSAGPPMPRLPGGSQRNKHNPHGEERRAAVRLEPWQLAAILRDAAQARGSSRMRMVSTRSLIQAPRG